MTDGQAAAQEGCAEIVLRHLARYPSMRLEDVYKLAHRACLGNVHAVPDRAYAERWLERELAQLGDGLPFAGVR